MDQRENSTRGVDDDEFAELRQNFRAPLFRPGDAGYDAGTGAGRLAEVHGGFIWNGRYAGWRPALIARPGSVADVVALVDFAREHEWHPAVRCGGHHSAAFATVDGDMVIDMSGMRNVRVDPERRTAVVDGGATWWDFDRTAQLHGLATVAGAISHTGVGGLTLMGGHGKLTRKYGYTLDNLIGVEIVTADGQVRIANEDTEQDLFWAVRGGGGNFGIVTAFEFQLHPVGPDVWLDMVWWPVEKAGEVLPIWRDWIPEQPPEMATSTIVVAAPPNRGLPADFVGRRFAIVTNLWHGPVEDGPAQTQPIRELLEPAAAFSRVAKYTEIQTMNDGMANAVHGFRNYKKSGYLQAFPDSAIEVYAEFALSMPMDDGLIELIAIDGPGNRVEEAATALGARRGRFNHIVAGGWQDPADDRRNIEWSKAYHEAMKPYYDAGVYLNYIDRGEEEDLIRSAYGDENWARLRGLKRQYDPDNLFRHNHNISPA